MSHLGRWPQLGKSLGQCDGQLKAQHRLHARDDNPRFGQELIDLGFDGRGLFRILCHRRFLSFGEPGHRVPAQHGQAKEYGRGHDRDPNGGHALHGDEQIERQGQGDRQERRAGEERGKNQDSATVLPTLDDAVLHGWGNQQRKRDHEEGQARAHKQPGYMGQKRELLLEYAIELETEKDLRAEDHQATFIERDLKLAFKLHGPGVIVPAWHPSLDCEVLPTEQTRAARARFREVGTAASRFALRKGQTVFTKGGAMGFVHQGYREIDDLLLHGLNTNLNEEKATGKNLSAGAMRRSVNCKAAS